MTLRAKLDVAMSCVGGCGFLILAATIFLLLADRQLDAEEPPEPESREAESNSEESHDA
jgi:hypothetical protein